MKRETKAVRKPPWRINWFGLAAGILMILLPFLGPWWRLTVGEAVRVEISPFEVTVMMLNEPVVIPTLVAYLVFAAKITIWIAGAFMILASLPERWWSRRLLKFGAMKVLWEVIGLVALLLIAAFVANKFLSSVVPGFSLPYVVGSTASTIEMEGATVTLPIRMVLTGTFAVAVVTAILGVAARIYHKRFIEPSKLKPSKV